MAKPEGLPLAVLLKYCLLKPHKYENIRMCLMHLAIGDANAKVELIKKPMNVKSE